MLVRSFILFEYFIQIIKHGLLVCWTLILCTVLQCPVSSFPYPDGGRYIDRYTLQSWSRLHPPCWWCKRWTLPVNGLSFVNNFTAMLPWILMPLLMAPIPGNGSRQAIITSLHMNVISLLRTMKVGWASISYLTNNWHKSFKLFQILGLQHGWPA